MVRRLKRTSGYRDTHASIIAAGVAFYVLGSDPALIALTIVYGLVASPADVRTRSGPSPAPHPRTPSGSSRPAHVDTATPGWRASALIAIAEALWPASSGMAALDTGLTVVNRETKPAAS